MPTPTKYTYSIASDFPEGKVATDSLSAAIQTSSIVTALDYINTNGDDCDVWFKDALSGGDETTLDGLVAAHDGEHLPDEVPRPVKLYSAPGVVSPLTSDGRPRLALEKTVVTKANFFSHNWCDKTTWYTSSVYVADETATDSGDHLTYTLAHQNVIDTYHGKLNQEDYLLDGSARTYRVTVKVNGTAKVERDPHYAAVGGGGSWDYTINYAAGTVTFQNALQVSDVVTVTYHYASTATDGTASRFKILPAAGRKLTLDSAKAQFTTDVDLQDTIMFQVVGYVDVFAPQLLQANGGPYAPGTQIPIQYFPYKTIYDLGEDAHVPGVSVPDVGENGNWRTAKALNVYRWDYIAGNVIVAPYGMEVWVYLVHDRPVAGTRATASFYCISEAA